MSKGDDYLDHLDQKIAEIKSKIDDVKKRWPFHSPKVALFEELENLELELEALKKQKESQNFSNQEG